MRMSYRGLLLWIALAGLAVGIAFGGGIAFGRNTAPETVVTVTSSGGGAASQGGATGSATPTPSQAAASGGQSATPTPAPTGGAGGFRQQVGTPVSGTVKSVEGNIVTVSTTSGDTKIQVGEGATIRKIENGALSDVIAGKSILATGQLNAEGVLVAVSIDIGQVSPRIASP